MKFRSIYWRKLWNYKMEDLYGPLDEEKSKRKKAGTESSKESSLADWFGRKGAKGSKSGWVDCNAPDGKGGYKACGRESGEKRKRYPSCRPTPGACKERGKGKTWGKKGKSKKNEEITMDLEQIVREELEAVLSEKEGKKDACYHKVKSRYKVWPSAYASGALVKCRKVGAKNWGNSKKEQLQAMIEDELTTVLQEKDYIPGGLTDKLTGSMEDKHKQLAKMHNVSLEDIEKEVSKGVKVEMEHTNDENIAHEIAMDHVFEDPKYYTKLSAQKLEESDEMIKYHIDNNIPFSENVYRVGSESYFKVVSEARKLYNDGNLAPLCEEDKDLFENSNLGEWDELEGERVPLDFPMYEETLEEKEKKDPPIGKPTKNTGGGKKYKVYVRNPKTGKVKKITYGDSKGGLKGNWNNAEARASFAARHNCKDKKDRTKAGYWACRAHKDFGTNVPGRFW